MIGEFLVEMRNISKSFFGIKVNNKINFTLRKGEIQALLGENGAGKTTLMNMLTGVYFPDEGDTFFKGKKMVLNFPGDALSMGIGMVHQRFSLVGNLTVFENLILGHPKNKFIINVAVEKILIQKYMKQFDFHINLDAIVDELPIGIRQKVEILKMLVREVDVLIVDEPTTVLTKQEADNLMQILRNIANSGKGIIFITHKMSEVFQVANSITVLRKGEKIATVNKEETTPNELARMMVGKEHNTTFNLPKTKKIPEILKIENLFVNSNNGVLAVKNLSFNVAGGEILSIAGVTGNGQIELADALTGNRKVGSGNIKFKNRDITQHSPKKRIDEGISYIPGDRINVGVAGNRSVWENLIMKVYRLPKFKKGLLLNNVKLKKYAEKIIQKYDIMMPGINLPALLLSGGNLQKLIIGREIERDCDLYICVYPTRGLDVGATEFVRNSILNLRNKGKAIILISGDFDEIFGLSDRIAVMCEGKFTGLFNNGDYSLEQIGLMMSGQEIENLEN
ncbi:MAG: ABC transporter ATP-binding protein [Candidatus Cloacimonetes bacterium]|nr:ABC transporter ATP-binding protein [Candidatus Cloacimonadota bacterium]MBT7468989.1 ABC transporter ATP-binding protein [Candidatus Cloacimonadota bacterium]